jgi:signal recognition particle receptor subunit beta
MKYKIIVAGPVGAGKTTAINSLTSKNSFMTDVAVSDEVTSKRKASTTVAMDFGVVNINGHIAHVYGTPGQQRFNFMWEILSEGADGLILLLDNTRNYPYRDLKYFVENFSDLIASKTLVVGVTRSDESKEIPLEAYQQWLKELNLEATVKFVDAREKEDVEQLVTILVEQISTPQQTVTKQAVVASSDNKEQIDEKTLPTDTDSKSPLEGSIDNIISEKQAVVLEKGGDELQTDEAIVPTYTATDSFNLDENTLKQVATLKDVEGVTLTNSYGELLHSTIDDDDTNEFIAFLSGITPALEDATGMGTINRIMLRGPSDDNLTIFVEEERSLGVSSNKVISVPALSQKIEDMLQWV